MNVTINLLPWRETLKKQNNFLFYKWLCAILLIVILVQGTAYGWLQNKIHFEVLRIHLLKKEHTTLLEKMKQVKTLQHDRENLLTQMDIIRALQFNRTELIKLLDSLPRLTPEGVYLTKLNRKNEKILVEGNAQTNAGISVLLKNLERNRVPKFTHIQLIEISTDRTINTLRFKLEINLSSTPE